MSGHTFLETQQAVSTVVEAGLSPPDSSHVFMSPTLDVKQPFPGRPEERKEQKSLLLTTETIPTLGGDGPRPTDPD